MTTELETARAKYQALLKDEQSKIWTTKENIASYVAKSINVQMYNEKPQICLDTSNGHKGKVVHRIDVDVLAEIVNHLGLEGFTAFSTSRGNVNLVKA